MENNLEMTISVFYNQSQWHCLLKHAFHPSLNIGLKNGFIENYYIFFRNNQGDHISIVLLFKEDNVFGETLIDYIKQFIFDNPSISKDIKYPLQGFFMDYPNNSAWIDIEHSLGLSFIHKKEQEIRHSISKILIDVMSDNEVDGDLIYTFLIYLQFGIIKAAYNSLCSANINSIKLLCYINSKLSIINEIENNEYDFEGANISFENNKEILLEIMSELWNEHSYSIQLQWLKTWTTECHSYLINSDFQQCFVHLSEFVFDHVGLNDKRLQYMFSSIVLNSFISLSNNELKC